ncbi:MAG TPA: aminotransferase [Cytophagales bacterium]|nr:aminotransferase [Cytophagales bacterium]
MNIDQLRNETQGTQHVIHLNNAGASLLPDPVMAVMTQYLAEEACYGGYEVAARHQSALQGFYATVARLLNAREEDIAYTTSATDAWTKLFYSLGWQAGDVILTGHSEYASNYIAFLQMQKKYGVNIEVIPNDEQGQVSLKALEAALSPKVKLVALTHMPTNGGLVNPAEAVGALTQAHGALYLLDACQSAGQYPLDVQKLGCDRLTVTGRKYLRGPRGTGFMYVNERVRNTYEPMILDLFSAQWTAKGQYETRQDARVFEIWEHNLAAKLGLKKAIEYALELGLENIWKRVQHVADYLRKSTEAIPRVSVKDLGTARSGIVSLDIENKEAAEVMQTLRQRKINTSLIVPSGTLLDMQDRKLGEMIRASVHYYNTEEEIDVFVRILKGIVS